jgi:hypothetical protein
MQHSSRRRPRRPAAPRADRIVQVSHALAAICTHVAHSLESAGSSSQFVCDYRDQILSLTQRRTRPGARQTALRFFRIVHGPGDAGSEGEFNNLPSTRQRGWLRLADAWLSESADGRARQSLRAARPATPDS